MPPKKIARPIRITLPGSFAKPFKVQNPQQFKILPTPFTVDAREILFSKKFQSVHPITPWFGKELVSFRFRFSPAQKDNLGDIAASEDLVRNRPVPFHSSGKESKPSGLTADTLKQRSRLNVLEAISRLSKIIYEASQTVLAGFDARILGQIVELLTHIDIAKSISIEDTDRDGTLAMSDRSNHVTILNKLETLTLAIKRGLRRTGFTYNLAKNIQTRLSAILAEFDGSDASHLEHVFSTFRQNKLHPQTMQANQALGAIIGGAVADAAILPYEERLSDEPVGLQEIEARIEATPILKGSDDTLTPVTTMKSLVRRGTLVPRDLASAFATLLPKIKTAGFGRSTKVAIRRLAEGEHWMQAGNREMASGNGAAMRIGPIAILSYRDLNALKKNVIMASQITHSDYEAIAGALAVAFIQAKIYRGEYRGEDIIDQTRRFIGPGRVASKLSDVSTLLEQRDITAEDAIKELGTGGVVWESVPASIYLFLRHNNDYKEMIEAAVKAGGDVDTISSIAGGLFGTLNGIDAIPLAWREKLEDGKEIKDLTRQLYDMIHTE